MDSGVDHSRVHDEYDQDQPHSVGLQHGGDEQHHDIKSVLKRAKAKARKIKDTITNYRHGHEGQHVPDDQVSHEEDHGDEATVEDPDVHGAPVYQSAAVKSAQVENLGHAGVNVGGTTETGDEHHQEPRTVVVSSTAESDPNRGTEPAGAFVDEDNTSQRGVNLDRPMNEDPHAPGSRTQACNPSNYQNEVTDPTGAGTKELDTTPIEESLARMNFHDEQKPNTALPIDSGTQCPSAGSHDQFSPEPTPIPSPTPTPTNASRLPEYPQETGKTFDTLIEPEENPRYEITEKPSIQSSYTEKPEYPQETAKTSDVITQLEEYPSHETTEKPSIQSSCTEKPEYPQETVKASDVITQPEEYPRHETSEKPSIQSSYTEKPEYPQETAKTSDVITQLEEYPSHETSEKPSTRSKYTDKLSPATSAIADKAISANDASSKLGYGEKGDRDENEMKYEEHKIGEEKPSNQGSCAEEISSATSDKAVSAKNIVASKLGYDEKDDEENKENEMEHEEHNIGEEKPLNQSSCTEKISSATSAIADETISAKNVVTSRLGYGEKDDRDNKETTHVEHKNGDAATKPELTLEYGKKIASTVTEKLAPVYGAVTGAGSAVTSKMPGTGTHGSPDSGNETENTIPKQDKGVSVKDYLAEKLRPGDEDRALSEVISDAYHKRKKDPMEGSDPENRPLKEVVSDAIHKREENPETAEQQRPLGKVTESEEVKRYLGTDKDEKRNEESQVNSPGKGMVDKLKGAVSSWFGKTGETPSFQEEERRHEESSN